jgi:hypothetical protein
VKFGNRVKKVKKAKNFRVYLNFLNSWEKKEIEIKRGGGAFKKKIPFFGRIRNKI